MEKYFTTKFNDKILIQQEYEEIHGKESFQNETKILEEKAEKELPKNAVFSRFLKNLFEYSIAIDFMKSLNLKTNWKSALDIGGQQGLISRIFTAEKSAQNADCVELYDFSKNANEDIVNWCFKTYNLWKMGRKMRLPSGKIRRLNRAYDSICENYGYTPNKSSKFWNLDKKTSPKINDYLVKDLYKHEKKYDLITAFLCMEYFDHTKLFKKIFDMLNDDGTFFFLVNYWWWPVNATKIVGKFPYAVQRLDKEDFVRYSNEFHEKESGEMIKAYNYFAGGIERKPTISDYINEAEMSGLKLVSYKRFMPTAKTHSKTPITPSALEECEDFNFTEIIENIRNFRKDVSIEDLKTAFVMGVFKKKKSDTSISNLVKNLQENGTGYYKNTNQKD